MKTTSNPLDRLAALAEQRRVKTSTLHAAVQRLLGKLVSSVEVGDRAVCGEVSLSRNVQISSVGENTHWVLTVGTRDESDYECCDPCEAIGHRGYLHGDFNSRTRGPSRAALLAFADAAPKLVEQLVGEFGQTNAALDAGAVGVVAL